MPFQSIVVPVDFSAGSRAALDLAIEIAKESGGTIHLLHAYQIIMPTPPMMSAGIPPELIESVREAAAKQLAEWAEIAVSANAKAEAHLSPASPSLAITAAVEQENADLIVMGTRGLAGLKHVMLGSIAERTVRTAPCPVLTVKAND